MLFPFCPMYPPPASHMRGPFPVSVRFGEDGVTSKKGSSSLVKVATSNHPRGPQFALSVTTDHDSVDGNRIQRTATGRGTRELASP